MDVITFPENMLTTSGLSILLHGVISLPVATSYDYIFLAFTVYFSGFSRRIMCYLAIRAMVEVLDLLGPNDNYDLCPWFILHMQISITKRAKLKNIHVFRVTRSYLLLVKPRFFSGFLVKIYNCMYFERRNAFQNA